MHDLVSKLEVITHKTFNLLLQIVLHICLTTKTWQLRTVVHVYTELTKASKINPMVWVEPEYLTFTSRESVPFFLHILDEVSCNVSMTITLELNLIIITGLYTPKYILIKIFERLLREFDSILVFM